MIEDFEITTHAGEITLYKLSRNWQRHRFVLVKAGCNGNRYDFPADQDMLPINGLPADETCWLSIRHGDLLKRFLSRPWKKEVVLRNRRLKTLITGSSRCGTRSLASFLSGLTYMGGEPAYVRHETLHEYILPALVAKDLETVSHICTGFLHDIEIAHHFSLMPQVIPAEKVVHLIRDGRDVVKSGFDHGWYQNDTIWNRIKPQFPGSPFEQCCHYWVLTNRNLMDIAHKTVRFEDLAARREAVDNLLDYLEISFTERPFRVADMGNQSSRIDRWTDEQKQVFKVICGDMMDTYYPNWHTG